MGTNTRAELLALRGLYFVKHRGIYLQRVTRDSKVIINWVLHLHTLQSINLHHWIQRVWGLLYSSLSLSICHVYREFNTQADTFSDETCDDILERLFQWCSIKWGGLELLLRSSCIFFYSPHILFIWLIMVYLLWLGRIREYSLFIWDQTSLRYWLVFC